MQMPARLLAGGSAVGSRQQGARGPMTVSRFFWHLFFGFASQALQRGPRQ